MTVLFPFRSLVGLTTDAQGVASGTGKARGSQGEDN
jgi:hypothetical protein